MGNAIEGHYLHGVENSIEKNKIKFKIFQLFQLERFRNYNEQWINMVESYQEMEDNTYYDQLEDDDKQPYLTADYLDQCLLYQDSDNMRVNSAMSNSSRPLSRYTRPQTL